MTTAVVFTCAHASPKVDNRRFDLLGNLIFDLRPDYVMDLGDFADLSSLNSYDTRYPKQIVTENYGKDIEVAIDAQERLRDKFIRRKVRRPIWIGFEGNHEHRIKRAIAHDPRLEGSKYGISFDHLQTRRFYDKYHGYENGAPAIKAYDGINYAHYIASGNYGTALSGLHHGYALTVKMSASATVGHSHKFSYFRKQEAYPNPIHGLVAGCFKGKDETWAGQANREWAKGVVVKRNIKDGNYDLQWISMEQLEKDYG